MFLKRNRHSPHLALVFVVEFISVFENEAEDGVGN
jgi:hypothetical protein